MDLNSLVSSTPFFSVGHRDRLEQIERQRERDRKLREQHKEQRDFKDRERRAEERRKEREARRDGQWSVPTFSWTTGIFVIIIINIQCLCKYFMPSTLKQTFNLNSIQMVWAYYFFLYSYDCSLCLCHDDNLTCTSSHPCSLSWIQTVQDIWNEIIHMWLILICWAFLNCDGNNNCPGLFWF